MLLLGPAGSGKTSVLIKSGVVLVERMVQGAESEEARPLLVVSSCHNQATTHPLMQHLDQATGGTGAEKLILSWPDLLKHCGLARADFKTREGRDDLPALVCEVFRVLAERRPGRPVVAILDELLESLHIARTSKEVSSVIVLIGKAVESLLEGLTQIGRASCRERV